jgi:hypothetical protein
MSAARRGTALEAMDRMGADFSDPRKDAETITAV